MNYGGRKRPEQIQRKARSNELNMSCMGKSGVVVLRGLRGAAHLSSLGSALSDSMPKIATPLSVHTTVCCAPALAACCRKTIPRHLRQRFDWRKRDIGPNAASASYSFLLPDALKRQSTQGPPATLGQEELTSPTIRSTHELGPLMPRIFVDPPMHWRSVVLFTS